MSTYISNINPQHVFTLIVMFWFIYFNGFSQISEPERIYNHKDIPRSYSNMNVSPEGNLQLNVGGEWYVTQDVPSAKTLTALKGDPMAAPTGIFFNFGEAVRNGTLYYGLINYEDSRYPLPVYFRSPVNILDGKAFINILTLKGRYDMVGWEEKGKGVLGYRVVDSNGDFLYDGRIGFWGTGPFMIDTTMIEGPMVNLLTHKSATISFETNFSIRARIKIDNKSFRSNSKSTHHEILLGNLQPDRVYEYTVHYGSNKETYSFKTAPRPGSRKPFIFAYASDSRSGQGGGERSFYGANAYIMKKIMALATYKNASFVQFTGDLITGYKSDPDEINLEFANWKRSVEPFTHYIPIIPGMGNHEAVMHYWRLSNGNYFAIDKFPFEEQSSEKIFSENFVNPLNGPDSEDGSSYDPTRRRTDFPSYKENVFYYLYNNVAMVVLNSDYWYAPSTSNVNVTSGNIHAYIMDNQMKWLENTLAGMEKNEQVDHVFITIHTPFFPNGGHVNDDMWYGGNNKYRPFVNGKPVEKGIIERRDQLLELIVNQSEKTVAILTGDEHNYCKTHITPETNLYPEDWDKPKLSLKRSIYQINNGAAGAPYYSQEVTPWTPYTTGFTTQNALVFFYVEGKKIRMQVLNPDTLDKVDELDLR